MKKDPFEKELKEFFVSDVPDPLNRIKQDPRFKVPDKDTGFSLHNLLNRKVMVSVLSVFILSLILVTSINRFSEPVVATTVTIDINPSIVITLDEDDFVIKAVASNDDAEVVLSRDITFKGLTIESFIDVLIERLDNTNYIITSSDDYNIILINVDSTNDTRTTQIQARFKNQIDKKMNSLNASHWVLNSDDIKLTEQQQQQFNQQFKLSTQSQARLTLIYRLSLIQDEYSSEELLKMSVINLYNLYIEYENETNLPNYDSMPGRNTHKRK
jgi:hypothetical protein